MLFSLFWQFCHFALLAKAAMEAIAKQVKVNHIDEIYRNQKSFNLMLFQEVITKLEVVPIWIGKEEILEVQVKPEELEVQAKPEELEVQAKLEELEARVKPEELEVPAKLEDLEVRAKLEESEVQAKLEVEADQVHKLEVLILIAKKKSEVTVKREPLPSNKLSHLS